MVVIAAPSCMTASVRQELMRRPSTRTVQAPHAPWSQPFLVPGRPARSRSMSSNEVRLSTLISRSSPFIRRCTTEVWPSSWSVTSWSVSPQPAITGPAAATPPRAMEAPTNVLRFSCILGRSSTAPSVSTNPGGRQKRWANPVAAAAQALQSGAGVERFDGGFDVWNDRGAVSGRDLTQRSGDVRADIAGGQDLLGDDDSTHHMGGRQPAVAGDLVAPVADLDALRLRPEHAASRRGPNDPGHAGEHADHQRDSSGPGECARNRAAHPCRVEALHQSLIGRTNDGSMVDAEPPGRTAVPPA